MTPQMERVSRIAGNTCCYWLKLRVTDLESSSEDTFASYAIKMWGATIGDANMEARGKRIMA